MTMHLSRRGFLQSASSLAGAALVIGFDAGNVLASADSAAEFTPFVRISADGRVTAIVKHFECGGCDSCMVHLLLP